MIKKRNYKILNELGFFQAAFLCLVACLKFIEMYFMIKEMGYTGQQQKYTLSESSQTSLILGRWFRVRYSYFSIMSKFYCVAISAVIESIFGISIFFINFEIILNFFHLKIKMSVICKKSLKFCDFF